MSPDGAVIEPGTPSSRDLARRRFRSRVVEDLPGGTPRLWSDAIGVPHVVVGGTPIVRDGVATGALPGTVLRSGRDTETVLP